MTTSPRLGTAETRTLATLKERYSHRKDILEDVLGHSKQEYLLIDTQVQDPSGEDQPATASGTRYTGTSYQLNDTGNRTVQVKRQNEYYRKPPKDPTEITTGDITPLDVCGTAQRRAGKAGMRVRIQPKSVW